ncbi:MAG: hypothetical protein BWX71_02632 [Deltaproteobacteria bacterium ADurb.Bin072]|nr:MAG: hypothetical protein BWX71_02632 [Deltaproteobacteria bacterium ADurb.Bin072]
MAPENLPSVMSATPLTPESSSPMVTARVSGMPGPPRGPSFRITTTSPETMVFSLTAARQLCSDSKILALPVKVRYSLATADCFTTAPSGARLPVSTTVPPSGKKGAVLSGMTFSSRTCAAATISPTVCPEAVSASRCRSSAIRFITAGIPPATYRSVMP